MRRIAGGFVRVMRGCGRKTRYGCPDCQGEYPLLTRQRRTVSVHIGGKGGKVKAGNRDGIRAVRMVASLAFHGFNSKDRMKGQAAMDIPRIFTVSESAHRIHNPFTPENLATLGTALRLSPESRMLDLGSGSGEMLCTWARDHGVRGVGIDMSPLFTAQAKKRAVELGVADRAAFIHGDAAGHVAEDGVDVAACIGATWIGGGAAGTVRLLARSLRPGGIILIGEPYWLRPPTGEDVARGCLAGSIADFLPLPGLLASFQSLGYDIVEMVLANPDGWDRYEAAKWLTMRRWLDANPDDDFAETVRDKLVSEPLRHAAYTREWLGWGVFALMAR